MSQLLMMASHEFKVGLLSAEAQAERATLKKLIAPVTTPAQILNATHYLDHLGHTDSDELRERVFEVVMQEGADFVRAWDEISFCRMVGEPVGHVVRIGTGSENKPLIEELHILAQHWVMLAGNGALGMLGEHKDVKTGEAGGGSMPGQLKAFLAAYKREKGFDQWTCANMSDARSRVVEVYYELQHEKGLFKYGSPANVVMRDHQRKDEANKVQERIADEEIKLGKMVADGTTSNDTIQIQRLVIKQLEMHMKECLKVRRRPDNSQDTGVQDTGAGGSSKKPPKLKEKEPRNTEAGGSSSLNEEPEPLRKRRRADLSSTVLGLTPRSKRSDGIALVEPVDLEAAKAATSAEMVKLLQLSNTAKSKALQVRRSYDNILDNINGVLAKWTEGHSVQVSSVEDVYMSDIYALQHLSAELQQAKASIEKADRSEAEAQKKLTEYKQK